MIHNIKSTLDHITTTCASRLLAKHRVFTVSYFVFWLTLLCFFTNVYWSFGQEHHEAMWRRTKQGWVDINQVDTPTRQPSYDADKATFLEILWPVPLAISLGCGCYFVLTHPSLRKIPRDFAIFCDNSLGKVLGHSRRRNGYERGTVGKELTLSPIPIRGDTPKSTANSNLGR